MLAACGGIWHVGSSAVTRYRRPCRGLAEIQRPVARLLAQTGLARAAAAVEDPPVWMPGGRGPAFRLGFRSGEVARTQWEARGDRYRVGNLILDIGASRVQFDLVPFGGQTLGFACLPWILWFLRFLRVFRSVLSRGVL